jgi:RNA polymerase sigma-70 factor (ECF subfamily)
MAFADDVVGLMPRLRLFALKLLRGREWDAEDLVQTTVLHALEKRDLYIDGNLAGWLMTMMYHCHVNLVRRSVREGRAVAIDGEGFVESDWRLQVPAPSDGALELVEVGRALAALEPEKRDVLLMIGHGADYNEIARALDINVGTVRSRLSRGRDELRVLAQRKAS